ncbi:MAG: hypothetical protein K940chlam9_01337 [Chlamydiae bacterium]|nr:hypothetical protein [Chlamydiota bacterium]
MQKRWKEKGELFEENESDEKQEALMVSFADASDSEMKSRLKAMGFKWNKFRKEFYGCGDRKSIENELKGLDFQIEVAAE